MSNRLAMIERLAAQTPTVNEQARKQLEAGQKIQLQQSLAAAPVAPTTRTAQAVAPQATTQAVNTNLAVAGQTQQQLGALGGAALGVKADTANKDLALRQVNQDEQINAARANQSLDLTRENATSELRMTRDDIASTQRVSSLGMEQDNRLLNLSLRQKEELSAIGRDIKGKIFDSRLQFEKDEAGRKFSNDRQMADYVLANAKTQQEFDGKMREMKQASDKSIMVLEHANRQITEAINRGWLTEQQKLDFEHKKALLEMQQKVQDEIRKKKAKAANKQMLYTGLFTIAGAVAGGVAGSVIPGAGTALGASAGAAVGGSVGNMMYGVGEANNW